MVDADASGGFVNVDGRFRNTSDLALTGMWVTISLEGRAGKLIRTGKAVCLPGTIEPGESGSFHGLVETDARFAGVKLEFSDLQKAFKWVDRSGKDAHQ